MTRQIEYHGELMSLAETIVGFPVGGQILISGWTYQRIYGRLHTIGALAPVKTEHKLRGASLMRGNSKLASWAKSEHVANVCPKSCFFSSVAPHDFGHI